MTAITRKRLDIDRREHDVLDVAREMVLGGGYHGLNMDRIARALGCSKGTVYNHFSCKEEILLALANATMDKRSDMFERAAAFQGGSRERMTAIGVAQELFVRLFPDHFKVEQIVRASSIWEKTSQERREKLNTAEGRCMGITSGIVRDAIARGDLDLASRASAEELVFGLWSMGLGAFILVLNSGSLQQLGVDQPVEALWKNYEAMLDGFGWRPPSTDFDLPAVRQRIQTTVFSEEFHTSSSR
jgi:AcrR family transcriptional regulator